MIIPYASAIYTPFYADLRGADGSLQQDYPGDHLACSHLYGEHLHAMRGCAQGVVQ